MLLRFAVENFRSIKNRQELSLVASSLKDSEEGLIRVPTLPEKVLPTAIIYGANASGKSNVLSALQMMRAAVLYSHSRGEPGGSIPRRAFRLDTKFAESPSVMEIDFALDGTRYHYGFEFNNDVFLCEWLYSFQTGRQTLLFRRELQSFSFGRALRGRNRTISELTRPNSLFLSAAAQNDHEVLSRLTGFFRSMLADNDISVSGGVVVSKFANSNVDSRVIDVLSRVGTGVVDCRRMERELSDDIRELQRAFFDFLKSQSVDTDVPPPDKSVIIELAHRARDGSKVYFDLDDESSGTLRLLMLLASAFRALDQGAPLVVDELDASLHTQACETVLSLFASSSTNPKGGQLIATTHDTNLLRSDFLRRDEIWFTEKDAEGATHLYPLTDFKTRKGDNLEKGYLEGRFGAIPFSGSVAGLLAGI